MASQLYCTTGGEREVGGSSRIHVEKIKGGPAAKGGREGEKSSDGRKL
jgi:hypothetical protein